MPYSPDIGRVWFFANAVNTRTQGVDVVASERISLGDKSRLVLTAVANFNKTEVRSFNSTSTTSNNDASLQNTLFDRQQRTRLEAGNPRSKINLSATFNYGIFGLEARSVRFGEVQTADADPTRASLDRLSRPSGLPILRLRRSLPSRWASRWESTTSSTCTRIRFS